MEQSYWNQMYANACDQMNHLHAMATEQLRPFNRVKPLRFFPEEDQWCVLYGEDLATGVAGFGNTPQEASEAFDQAWFTSQLNTSPPGRSEA